MFKASVQETRLNCFGPLGYRLSFRGWEGDDFGCFQLVRLLLSSSLAWWRAQQGHAGRSLGPDFVFYLAARTLSGRCYTFRFALDSFDELLDEHVDSACWDNLGNLVYSRDGLLYKYSLADLTNGRQNNG